MYPSAVAKKAKWWAGYGAEVYGQRSMGRGTNNLLCSSPSSPSSLSLFPYWQSEPGKLDNE